MKSSEVRLIMGQPEDSIRNYFDPSKKIYLYKAPMMALGYIEIRFDNDNKIEDIIKYAQEIINAYRKGHQIIMYGYSAGAVFLQHVARYLAGQNVYVDLMITVDAADGPYSYRVNRYIPSSIKVNVNFFQTNKELPLFSYGGKNYGSKKTIIKNYDLSNMQYNGKSVNHSSIDEEAAIHVIRLINQYIQKNK